MKTLTVLIVLVIAVVAAFFTRPHLKEQQANADKLFAEQTAKVGDDSAFEGGPAYVVRAGKFQDFLVGTKFTSSTGERILVTCWGVFGNFLCIAPDEKPATASAG